VLTENLLSVLIGLPLVSALLVLLVGDERKPNKAWLVALLAALAELGVCVWLYQHFDASTSAMQFVEYRPWIPAFDMYYSLGIDGLSLALILLTAFTTLVVVLAAKRTVTERLPQYLAAFLVLHASMIGVFAARDTLLFYVFWEAMLIPMYLIIGMWGHSNRSYAAVKFFLYTFLGSALMLVALLYLHGISHSFALDQLYASKIAFVPQLLIFGAFFLAFAVKIPMWPVHTWLPDAHTEAPAGGSVILAAIMLKMGAYGFLRFSLPILPDASLYLAWVMIALSLVAIIYIGLVAIVQTDMKRLIAYSSIAHMGIVTLGCFTVYLLARDHDAVLGMQGAIVQMLSHAFTSGAMFIGVGFLYTRLHTRAIKDFGGIANHMPVFASFFMLFAMANVGLPGTSGFVGEFMVLLNVFQASLWVAVGAASTLILAAVYTLWMYKRVFFGKVTNPMIAIVSDVDGLEIVVLVLLAVPVLAIGIYPQPLLQLCASSVTHLLELAQWSKLV
jgi:NADH-quinone oxidoreductase subunit M